MGDAATQEVVALGEVSVAGNEVTEKVALLSDKATEEVAPPGDKVMGSWDGSNYGREDGSRDWINDGDTTIK